MKNLKLLIDNIIELVLVCVLAYIVCPPKVFVGDPVFHGNEFIWGIMQGIMAFFGWVISFCTTKTGYPGYIQNGEYWHGYWIGVVTFVSGCYLQLTKMYKHKIKNGKG